MKKQHRFIFLLLSLAHLCMNSCAQKPEGSQKIRKHTKQTAMYKSEEEWKKKLTEEQYYVLREKGTERPFTGALLHNKEKGTYVCAGCGEALFTDEMKFDSHCGWPSFDREIEGNKITKTVDRSHGMVRTEITCSNCGGHLGHLFDDGPTISGMRYCVNSLSLSFKKQPTTSIQYEEITLGGGCFWCTEAVYLQLKGVIAVVPGYSGGKSLNPSYEQVCTGTTEHAEVVNITYNPTEIGLKDILEVFFTVHDPTTLNRQGADIGTQYRSVIYYRNAEQEQIARDMIAQLQKDNVFNKPIVTELSQFSVFYKAEDYHLNYYNQNKSEPYCRMVIAPKIEKFQKKFSDKMVK